MSTIQNLFQQAQLAEAAYAKFSSFANPKDALIDIKFSDVQASDFVNNWRVADQLSNPSTGFSATVFEKLERKNGVREQFFLI